MIDRDVALIICSRGREDALARLLRDLHRAFTPALDAGGLSHCVWVYAQGYAPEYLARLRQEFALAVTAQNLVVTVSDRRGRPHGHSDAARERALQARHDHGR
jgi:hypothetical protein